MNTTVRLFSTGGTIDSSKDYHPDKKSIFDGTNVPAMIAQARLSSVVAHEPLMQKDSADITQSDWELILKHCLECDENSIIIITHGTDTMVETARFLGSRTVPGKTVVLTGSFIPFSQEGSDALANLGYAVATAQKQTTDVWIAIDGQTFHWTNVRKNVEKNKFDYI